MNRIPIYSPNILSIIFLFSWWHCFSFSYKYAECIFHPCSFFCLPFILFCFRLFSEITTWIDLFVTENAIIRREHFQLDFDGNGIGDDDVNGTNTWMITTINMKIKIKIDRNGLYNGIQFCDGDNMMWIFVVYNIYTTKYRTAIDVYTTTFWLPWKFGAIIY